MELRPIGDKIIIRKVETEQKTKGGLLLPETVKEAPQYSEVIAIGPEILADEKKKDQIKVGDKVVFTKYAGTEIEIDDEKLTICKLSDLLAVAE